ncbi:MAG: hypothetical protein APG12_00986 [Candidatus Methanofastidiosum methylothiophilum]|uniref:DUF116 domain-containing protein n=1 Tax=Candidatus Methanofastidiosum methylothiophilum TaxID=1705564 RepID=A0A150IJ79_9EURY|nr:MAG: hypothetical protein APG10_01204 [Candidatus Methanofastidiosum methylthiophilus]KYC47564.1 MAG: hypothetical protein APG11_01065 [Candidatus Methanofastidiosum methylthiophilus]KYC50168.1 MAG: hypothetical protein APG12_00986 [Candidatus Methanofastidiosum methylthiophilus]
MNELPSFFSVLGVVFVILIFIFGVLLLISIVLIYSILRKKKIIFPRTTLFLLDTLYYPLKRLVVSLNLDESVVDKIEIDIRNKILKNEYFSSKIKDRIVVFPYCLRSVECKAHVSPELGVNCIKCGKCKIGNFKEICDENSIKVFIAPGGSFVKRVLKKHPKSSVLLVACHVELNEMMRILSAKRIPEYGILLEKTGCIETDVDMELVKDKLFEVR